MKIKFSSGKMKISVLKIMAVAVLAVAMSVGTAVAGQITITTRPGGGEQQSICLGGQGTAVIEWTGKRSGKQIKNVTLSDSVKIDGNWDDIIIITGDNITYLECTEMLLKSIDVSKNPKLKKLSLPFFKNYGIHELDVSKNVELTELNLEGQLLHSLNVSKNINLTRLNCKGKYLTKLDVSRNSKLSVLNCSGQSLSSLDVSKNTELTELYCSLNDLTSLNVSKNTKLLKLDCRARTGMVHVDGAHKALTVLDVSKNTALTHLICDYNSLTFLDISQNKELIELSCSNNKITFLDISQNTDLIELNCSNNKITGLDASKNINLKKLVCDKDVKVSGSKVKAKDARSRKRKFFDIDLFSSPKGSGIELLYAILIISVLTLIIRWIKRSAVVGYVSLLLISGMEIIYFLILDYNLWFCIPGNVGWGYTILNAFLYGFVLIYQLILFTQVEEELRSSSHIPEFGLGTFAIIAVVIIYLLSLFFSDIAYDYPNLLSIIVGSIIVLQVILIFVDTGCKNRFAAALLFAVYMAGTVPTFLHFSILAVIAFIAFGFLKSAGSAPSRTDQEKAEDQRKKEEDEERRNPSEIRDKYGNTYDKNSSGNYTNRNDLSDTRSRNDIPTW
jgi:hypothetical protein